MNHLPDQPTAAPHTSRAGRRYARLVRPDGRCRVLPLLERDDPRLDVPTYLRRGLRIPGINCEGS